MNFKKLGDELSRQDSYNMNVLKIKKGLELLSYAAIIAIINALLAYILPEILIGLFALIYLIVLYVGLFKTGSGMTEFQPQIFTQPVSNGKRPEEFGTFNSPQPSDITKMNSEKICPKCGSIQFSGIFCAKCGTTLD